MIKDSDCSIVTKQSLVKMLIEDVKCVFLRDPAARTLLEVMTTYPGVHALILHRFSHILWCRGFKYLARFISYFTRWWTNIDIHPGARIGRRFFIDHGAGVVIGETSQVGNDVTLYHGVTLGGTTWNKGRRHPTLDNGVMVGAGAKILGPITIGTNTRVGSNSVVVKDTPPDSTVVGIPAKIVQNNKTSELNSFGIDLNHHLIPDPVGKAISYLTEHLIELEQKVDKLSKEAVSVEQSEKIV